MRFFLLLAILISTGLAATCPNVCRNRRREARQECRQLRPDCAVERCTGGFICTEASPGPTPSRSPTPSPAAVSCPNICTSTRRANRACATLVGTCDTATCVRPNGRNGRICKPVGVTVSPPPAVSPTSSPTGTPSPSPSNEPCNVCSSNQFVKRLANGQCRCVNNACDACPEGTICRTVDFVLPMTQVNVVYCQRCDCGYCDADGDNCCRQNGANCEKNPFAVTSQCQYGDFADGIPATANGDNVCTDSGDPLIFNQPTPGPGNPAPRFLRQCACRPSFEEPCVISSDPGQTFCNIPRCNASDNPCVR